MFEGIERYFVLKFFFTWMLYLKNQDRFRKYVHEQLILANGFFRLRSAKSLFQIFLLRILKKVQR